MDVRKMYWNARMGVSARAVMTPTGLASAQRPPKTHAEAVETCRPYGSKNAERFGEVMAECLAEFDAPGDHNYPVGAPLEEQINHVLRHQERLEKARRDGAGYEIDDERQGAMEKLQSLLRELEKRRGRTEMVKCVLAAHDAAYAEFGRA